MTFVFRAHRPSAYLRFAVFLFVLIVFNLAIIGVFFPELKTANDAAQKSIILIVPWLLLLLLPSVISGILVYKSFVKTYRFTIEDSGMIIGRLKRDQSMVREKKYSWHEVKSLQIVDFEDNHYCNLELSNQKDNLVIHRESGEFEKFYETLKEYSGVVV